MVSRGRARWRENHLRSALAFLLLFFEVHGFERPSAVVGELYKTQKTIGWKQK
jgi:hypothetical protein